MIQRKFLIIGSLMAILAVGLGAFAAHGLKPHLTEYQISIFETGTRYHFYHTFAILWIALLADKLPSPKLNAIGWLFTIGIVFFSGSLYLLATRELIGIHWAFLGPMTPLGGLLFIIGWVILLVEAIKK
jgi:uncharacterized membrane protein YgdD (TMEM256/DUF423 family)